MFVSNFIQNFDQLKQYGPPRCGLNFTVIVLKKEGVRFIYVNILVLGPITKFESYDFFQLNMNGHKMLLLLSDLITILLINQAVCHANIFDYIVHSKRIKRFEDMHYTHAQTNGDMDILSWFDSEPLINDILFHA